MSGWKHQIEAQIAELRRYSYESDDPTDGLRQLVDSMHNAATQLEVLLDVAVAAGELNYLNQRRAIEPFDFRHVNAALRKLREMGDE